MSLENLAGATIEMIVNFLKQHNITIEGFYANWSGPDVDPPRIEGYYTVVERDKNERMTIASRVEDWPIVKLIYFAWWENRLNSLERLQYYGESKYQQIKLEVDMSSNSALTEILEFWNENSTFKPTDLKKSLRAIRAKMDKHET